MNPLTMKVLSQLQDNDYSDIQMVYAAHIEPKMIPHLEFFIKRGMQLHIAPCVPSIEESHSFSYLEGLGAKIYGREATSWGELESAWTEALKSNPSRIFDIGGGVIRQAVNNKLPIKVASEATSTGIHHIKQLPLPFPVFDWNDISFKNLMHNRYEVGPGIWYAFRKVTGLDICRLKVGVIGFGLVGHGVAAIARGMGAQVFVTDLSPMMQLEAASEGYVVTDLKKLLSVVDVVVTATGKQSVLTTEYLMEAKDGVIVLNAGHDSREIHLVDTDSVRQVLPHVEEYQINGKKVYLLAQGRLLNLAAGGGSAINTFDLVTALIALTVDYISHDRSDYSPGLHLLPETVISTLQREAATRLGM